MVDTFHKLQENIRLRAYCGYSSCFFFRYDDRQEGNCSGVSFHGLVRRLWSFSNSLVLRLMAKHFFPLWCLWVKVEGEGDGVARAAGMAVTRVRHPCLFLYVGSLNRDRYLSPKTPSPYLETLTPFEKR